MGSAVFVKIFCINTQLGLQKNTFPNYAGKGQNINGCGFASLKSLLCEIDLRLDGDLAYSYDNTHIDIC